MSEDHRSWYDMSRYLGFDEVPSGLRIVRRRRWFNRQRRIYWMERALGLAPHDTFPPFWRDDP